MHDSPSQWTQFLSLAEWCYNTAVHSATGITPYEATYGKPPPSLVSYIKDSSSVEAVDSLLSSRQDIWVNLQIRLQKAQQAMKIQADRKCRDVSYSIGDWVYVKLQPYRHLSLTRTTFHKLSKHYYGPFRITKAVGAVAYRLALPAHSKIHNVFHCSLLKPHHGPVSEDVAPLPPQASDHHPLVEPLSILDTKWDTTTSPPSLLVLVQWNGLAPEETSWEHWDDLRSVYHLEDKVVLPAAGIDSIQSTRPERETQQPVTMYAYEARACAFS